MEGLLRLRMGIRTGRMRLGRGCRQRVGEQGTPLGCERGATSGSRTRRSSIRQLLDAGRPRYDVPQAVPIVAVEVSLLLQLLAAPRKLLYPLLQLPVLAF